jgi:hypothetical protein
MSNIANLARVPVVTDIRFNKARIDESGNIMHKWGQVNHELSQRDQELLGEDIVNSYSQMKVEEYVNFSKTFTPYMRWEVHAVEAVSPVNQARCEQPKNQAAVTECLNNWFLGGM